MLLCWISSTESKMSDHWTQVSPDSVVVGNSTGFLHFDWGIITSSTPKTGHFFRNRTPHWMSAWKPHAFVAISVLNIEKIFGLLNVSQLYSASLIGCWPMLVTDAAYTSPIIPKKEIYWSNRLQRTATDSNHLYRRHPGSGLWIPGPYLHIPFHQEWSQCHYQPRTRIFDQHCLDQIIYTPRSAFHHLTIQKLQRFQTFKFLDCGESIIN